MREATMSDDEWEKEEEEYVYGGYRDRLNRWVAKALAVPVEQVVAADADVVGGCGEGTCEFTIVEIDVRLADGREFHAREDFGSYFSEILKDDLDDDGNFSDPWHQTLFDLKPVEPSDSRLNDEKRPTLRGDRGWGASHTTG